MYFSTPRRPSQDMSVPLIVTHTYSDSHETEMQFVFSEALYKKTQPQGGINNMKKIPCILITPVVKEQRHEDIF